MDHKLTKTEKELIYSALYLLAQRELDITNPCKFEHGRCFKMSKYNYNGCCHDCEHLTDTGCSVEALGCKLWLCGMMVDKHTKLYIKLRDIEHLARKLDVPVGVRLSKEQNLFG